MFGSVRLQTPGGGGGGGRRWEGVVIPLKNTLKVFAEEKQIVLILV